MVITQETKSSVASRAQKTENHLLLLIKELELALALSSAFSPSQAKRLKSAILKLTEQLS